MSVMQKIRRYIFGDEIHRKAQELEGATGELAHQARRLNRALVPILEADDPFAALAHQVHNARHERSIKE